jgi:FKBP-type peptidyl-prolyl cis-trans isomerase SlyD
LIQNTGLEFARRNCKPIFFHLQEEKTMKIGENMYVSIEYALKLDSGQEIDRSQEGRPLGFITGARQIIPGLEKALIGMSAGDAADIIVEPEDAYGPVRDDMFQDIPKSQFPADIEIKKGMSFEAQGPRGPFMIVVSRVNDDDTITVDLNHPLAGQRLHFAVKVIEMRQPSAEEIAALSSAGCACNSAENESSSSGCGPGCNCG